MPIDLPLESLSVAQKVQILESVWESLCGRPGDVSSPDWHREVLEERKRRLEEGKAKVSSWMDAKARFLEVGQ